MKNKLMLVFGILVACVLLAYMLMFQVRFDEQAIRATAGKADDESVITEPGLKFRLPWPFQQVHRYSTRAQLLEIGDRTVQTSDNNAVTVRMFLTWKITDPLAFYNSLKDESKGSSILAAYFGDHKFGGYRFDQLVNTDSDKLKLNEIEELTAKAIQDQVKDRGYGITIIHVGISRIVLEDDVSEKVFARMESNRQSLAADVRTRGASQARTIVSKADGVRRTIIAFADKYAKRFATIGKKQAAHYYKIYEQDEEFAIFLRQIEALEVIFSQGHSQIMLDAGKLSRYNPIRFFMDEPDSKLQTPLRPDAGKTTAKPNIER
jgi:modulator of FtsH protease HflC